MGLLLLPYGPSRIKDSKGGDPDADGKNKLPIHHLRNTTSMDGGYRLAPSFVYGEV